MLAVILRKKRNLNAFFVSSKKQIKNNLKTTSSSSICLSENIQTSCRDSNSQPFCCKAGVLPSSLHLILMSKFLQYDLLVQHELLPLPIPNIFRLSDSPSTRSLSQGESKLRGRLCYLHAKTEPALSSKYESHPEQFGSDWEKCE